MAYLYTTEPLEEGASPPYTEDAAEALQWQAAGLPLYRFPLPEADTWEEVVITVMVERRAVR